MKTWFLTGTLLGALTLFGGCFYEESRAPAPMVPASAAGVMHPADAAVSIAAARCDREARCGGIGPTAPYMTREHCMSVMRSEAQQALSSCQQYGTKEREVRACSAELETQTCGPVQSPFSWLGQVMTCHPNNLCLR